MNKSFCSLFLASAAILLLSVAAASSTETQTATRKASPGTAKAAATADPALIDLAGYKQLLVKYKGKPVVVNFWATWCEPCREEYPMVVDLAKHYAPQGVVVLGIDMDDEADMNLVRRFLARTQPGFTNYRQKPGIDLDAFYQAVNPSWGGTMPQTIFYGRDGRIAGFFIGTRSQQVFDQAFRGLLVTPAGN